MTGNIEITWKGSICTVCVIGNTWAPVATLPAVVGGARNIFLAIRLSGLSLRPNFPSNAPFTPFISSEGDGVRCKGGGIFLRGLGFLSHSEVGPSSIPCSACVHFFLVCQKQSTSVYSQYFQGIMQWLWQLFNMRGNDTLHQKKLQEKVTFNQPPTLPSVPVRNCFISQGKGLNSWIACCWCHLYTSLRKMYCP